VALRAARLRAIVDPRRLPPPAVLLLAYGVFVLAGAALLMLPVARTGPLAPGDALFTAVSAVTVTGLAVADTGSAFTGFGQAVILVLIQLGGLGLMSFAVLIFAALGIPVRMSQRLILREDLDQTSIHNLMALVRLILRFALVAELAGTIVLAFVFVPREGWAQGLWSSVFHAVSAFNNAGFALYPDSLTDFRSEPVINLAIPALFILGGLGFVVIADLWQVRGWRKLTLHSKLTLAGSALLILAGFAGVAALEWRNPATLGGIEDGGERLMAAWFQGVTPRTAGFNTLDFAGMHDATALLVMLLMIVGGGSASTAGGIKVTTAAVLLLATLAFFRRHKQLHAFGRSLGNEELLKVLALVVVSFIMVVTGTFLVAISHDGDFLDLAFEVVSAFGTVGLSRGATGELDGAGRAAIMVLMFAGRVGPLTLGFFLATRSTPRVRYPAGRVYLG